MVPPTARGRSTRHTDNVKDECRAKLVQVNTLKAHGVAVNEGGL